MTDGSGRIQRRVLLGLAALGGVMTLASRVPAGGRSVPPDDRLSFVVYRDGSEIGWHEVRFARRGAGLQVDVEIRLDVIFGFIPLYRYRHRNRELWRGERLVELAARTVDDGAESWVEAQRRDDRLIVASSAGALELPGSITPTSHWNEARVLDGAWLDTQSGRLVRSRVAPQAPEPIRVGSRTVMAKRYVLAGDIDCELWYHDGRWVKLRFRASDGSMIDYAA